MLAAILAGPGASVDLDRRADPPLPGRGELLVRMLRAPINPADLLLIAGRYPRTPQFPHILGAEGVGRIEAVGPGITDLAAGDCVLPLTTGNWASYRLLARTEVVKLPAALPLDDAARLRINPATALRLLRQAPLAPGDWLIQNGARSHVASWVRRLARDMGCNVIDVVRDTMPLPGSSATIVDGEDLTARVAAMVGGGRVALALDCVAGQASGRLAATLSEGASLLVYGHLSGQPCTIPSTLLTGRGLQVRGFSLRPDERGDGLADLQQHYDRLAAIAAEPAMRAPVAACYPLARIADALAHAARPAIGGRVMIALDDIAHM